MAENKHFRIEYLLKGMKLSDHKKIMFELQNKFNGIYRDWILKFNDDYKNGYEIMAKQTMFRTKKAMDDFLQARIFDLESINQIMTANNLMPLFPNPQKLVESWNRRDHLLERLPDTVLNKEFNCKSFSEYTPAEYHPESPQQESTHTPK